jgi:protein-L-isoaspartate(D-aspartate) O-methyltransferase
MENSKRFETKVQLLLKLISTSYLRDIRLFKAFLELRLEDFIPRQHLYRARIYEDIPNLFYYDKDNPEKLRTISAPHMISIMLQGLVLDKDDRLLILGAKSGYIAALAQKLSLGGKIVILEANAKIAKITADNLKKLNYKNIEVVVKNPLEGLAEQSPWKKILVTGAIKQERIYPLLKQLDPNSGVLFAPIGEDYVQIYTQILRIHNDFYGAKQLQVRFTPLITDVELDELELITDAEDMTICEESDNNENIVKGKEHLKCSNITIKYANEILDEIQLEPFSKFESLNIRLNEIAKVFLENIDNTIDLIKTEENVKISINGIENVETQIKVLKNYNKELNININKIQNSISQIKTYLVIKKELNAKKELSSSDQKEKMEITKNQIKELENLREYIRTELDKLNNL